ncbi:pilus assembly protein TadG-related protein [Zavarzinella formosa]|uniref:pilus assembly protein TadG-related protein n=1 Tax=Zavarzinella formosa TaxID=360055 RepID=UPI0002DC1DF4|nr:pilus assembly protein TadG-related protein [Zavarzinella formosa]
MRTSSSVRRREAAVLPLVTVCLVALLSFVALAIDIGMMAVARTQAQSTADIGALAGARTLNGQSGNNRTAAEAEARQAITNNYILTSQFTTGQISAVTSGVYRYDTTASRFTADFSTPPGTNEAYGVMQVQIQTSQPTYFGRVMGVNAMQVNAQATAVHRPRDLCIVLDFSGSMKFSSEYNYPSNITGTTPITGTLNPDPRFPQFGPWKLYPLATAGNPNPMHRVDDYVDSGGETHAANNLTIETASGPPIVNCFQTTAAVGGPNAFVYGGDLTAASFNISNTPVCTPAPATWNSQYASGYVGDRWPLNYGVSTTNPTIAQYAKTAADLVFASGTSINTSTRDNTWETNGYDSASITWDNGAFSGYSMGPGYYGKTFYMWPPDPRYNSSADPTNISTTNSAQDTSGRWMCDWRKRFFLYPSASSGTKGAVMDDNSVLYSTSTGLFQSQNLGASPIRYIPHYDAILKWLKNGPQTLPPSLRAGRVLYYSAIPDSIPMDWKTGLVGSSATDEQRFWKEYIDFVIGCGQHNRAQTLNGNDTDNSYGGNTFGTVKITPKASLTGTTKPYMHYQDVPVHPCAHLWFGPLTMLGFISLDSQNQSYNWNAGTTSEAHCWQMKAGIRSAMTDIQNNHPNDLAALTFFSNFNAWNTARVSMSKNYTTMQNCLYYPYSLINSLGTVTSEKKPYTTASISASVPSGFSPFNYQADIPLADGGTDTAMGLMVAYNQFNWNGGYTGRKGASKIVILETDGVANANASGTLSTISGGGGTKQWTSISDVGSSNGTPSAMNAAITLAYLITQDSAGSKPWPTFPAYSNLSGLPTANAPTNYYSQTSPGFSTTRSPAYVHTIAFGQLFEASTVSNMKTRALEFLRNVQIAGGTSPAGATSIDSYKIITGTSTARISSLRQALERIMQGGVQVALVQ